MKKLKLSDHGCIINNIPTRVVKHGDDINRFDSWPKFYKK